MYEQPFNPFAANLAIVKDYFKQTKVLVLGILYIVSAIISVVSTIITAGSANDYFADMISLLERIGLSDMANRMRMILESLPVSSTLISSIPSMVVSTFVTGLFAAAFIIIYIKSRNTSEESTPNTGVNILYVLSVISLVIIIISTVLGGLGLLGMIVLAVNLLGNNTSQAVDLGNGYQLNITGSAIGVLLIVFSVIALIVIIYLLISAINCKRFYRSVKDSINTVELQNKGAKGYGVICVINAVFSAFSLLSLFFSLFSIISYGASSGTVMYLVMSLISGIVNFLILVFTAGIALGYKKYIDNIKYGYNGTPDGGMNGYNPIPTMDNTQPPYGAPQPMPYNDNFNVQPQQPAAPSVCPNCGAPTDGSPFCGNCGARL